MGESTFVAPGLINKPETGASSADATLQYFLSHTNTRNLINMYSAEISAARSIGRKVHMGETGSVACHGKDAVSNTLGAALWEIDYALTGATAGIDRFFFHAGVPKFYYSPWEPMPPGSSLEPFIRPQ